MKQDVERQEVRQFGGRDGVDRLKGHQGTLALTEGRIAIHKPKLGWFSPDSSSVWGLVHVCVIHEVGM